MLVNPEKATEMLDKKKEELQKEIDKPPATATTMGGIGGGISSGYMGGASGGSSMTTGGSSYTMGGGVSSYNKNDSDDEWWLEEDEPQEHIDMDGENSAPKEAQYEMLPDGSTALVVPAGTRLHINLEELTKGGDAKRLARKIKAENDKKKKTTGFYGSSFASKWSTEYVDTYTITMDVKFENDPPPAGISLFNTALAYTEDVRPIHTAHTEV